MVSEEKLKQDSLIEELPSVMMAENCIVATIFNIDFYSCKSFKTLHILKKIL